MKRRKNCEAVVFYCLLGSLYLRLQRTHSERIERRKQFSMSIKKWAFDKWQQEAESRACVLCSVHAHLLSN